MSVNHSTAKPLQVAAAVIGNALEWYDFIIFGFLTVVIARLFFPAESQYASLLPQARDDPLSALLGRPRPTSAASLLAIPPATAASA